MADTNAPPARKRRSRVVTLLAVLLLAGVVVGAWWYWSGSPRATLAVAEVCTAVAFSPDGRVLAAGGYRYAYERHRGEGIISLWEVSTGRRTASWVAHGDFIGSVAFDPGGHTLTSTGVVRHDDGEIGYEAKTWDAATRAEVRRARKVKSVRPFPVTSPDGQMIATHGGRGTLVLTDAAGEELFRLEADPFQLNCAAFSPGGSVLATGGGSTAGGGPSPYPAENGDLRLWDTRTGRLLVRYNRHWWGPIQAVAFSPDGRLVASASLDGTVKLWRVPAP